MNAATRSAGVPGAVNGGSRASRGGGPGGWRRAEKEVAPLLVGDGDQAGGGRDLCGGPLIAAISGG